MLRRRSKEPSESVRSCRNENQISHGPADDARQHGVAFSEKKKTAESGSLFLSRCLLFQANDTLRRDCRNAKPRPAKPISIIAHVLGSGTDDPTVTDSGIADTCTLFGSPLGRYIAFQVYVPSRSAVKP